MKYIKLPSSYIELPSRGMKNDNTNFSSICARFGFAKLIDLPDGVSIGSIVRGRRSWSQSNMRQESQQFSQTYASIM